VTPPPSQTEPNATSEMPARVLVVHAPTTRESSVTRETHIPIDADCDASHLACQVVNIRADACELDRVDGAMWVTIDGRPDSLLSACRHVVDGELGYRREHVMRLNVRGCGGGGDGGTTGTEDRAVFLEMYKAQGAGSVDPTELRAARWSRCTLSEEELTPPLVMDGLGQLFNKEALINALLTQSLPRQLQHIARIGDVFDVKLTPSDESKMTSSSLKGKCGAATSAAMFSGTSSLDKCLFMCPVTGLPFNGKFRFVALLETGEVLSAKAVREIHSHLKSDAYIPIYSEDKEERASLRTSMEARRLEREQSRKLKKKRKRQEEKEDVKQAPSATNDDNL